MLSSTGKDAVALAETESPTSWSSTSACRMQTAATSARRVRSRGVESPVLFLTARDRGRSARGFSAGGDDYLTKPFEFAELIARLRALLRRSRRHAADRVAGDLRLDPAVHAVASGESTCR